LRHEGHEMKLKFVTPRQASKDQYMLKEKIEKERNINYRRKGNWRKRKGRKDTDDGKESRETRCFIEGHPCLVAFVYESENNVVSKRLEEKALLPTSFHPNQARIKFLSICERSIMWYCSHKLLSSSFKMGMTSF